MFFCKNFAHAAAPPYGSGSTSTDRISTGLVLLSSILPISPPVLVTGKSMFTPSPLPFFVSGPIAAPLRSIISGGLVAFLSSVGTILGYFMVGVCVCGCVAGGLGG